MSLREFIREMTCLARGISPADLKRLLQGLEARQGEVHPYIRFSEKCYTRNLVYKDENFEVTVTCWKGGQGTPIHDHGRSLSGLLVYQGILTEEVFEKTPEGPVRRVDTREINPGQMACLESGGIHRVSNQQEETLVAIHIYVPPLAVMNIYSLDNASIERHKCPAIAPATTTLE